MNDKGACNTGNPPVTAPSESEKWATLAAYHRERDEWAASRLAAQVSDALRFYELHLAALERGAIERV